MANEHGGLDPGRPAPLYHQLKQLLLDDIEAGRLVPGDRLPTEHELCAVHAVSRTPVNRALSELAAEGVITRHRRRGSFVNAGWSVPGRPRAHLSLLLPEAPVVPAPSEGVSEVAIDVTLVPSRETNAQVLRLVAEGAAPDLALVDLGRLAPLVDAGLVRALDVDVVARVGPSLGPAPGGASYAIPVALSLTGLWLPGGLDAWPATWDQLLDFARAHRDTGSLGSPIVLAGEGDAGVDALLTVVASNHRRGDALAFDDEASTEALRLIRGFVGEGLMSSDVVGSRSNAAIELLVGGDAVAMIGSSTDATRLESASRDFTFGPFPGGPLGEPVSLLSGWGMVVTRQSQRPALATRTAAEIALQSDGTSAAALGLVPAAATQYGAPARDGADFGIALAAGRPRPWAAGQPVLAAQLERVLASVVSGRLRPVAAAAAAQQVLDAITVAGGR